jgi:glycosyltransferase involved in cell wall biosynthesis
MTKPLVSVIIPTYNRAHKISDAISSVLNQIYPNIQLIVVDDGSTDHTRELLRNYPEIEYVWQQNGGQAAARNTGLSKAKGSIIASLDSDDIWETEFLQTCVTKLEEDMLDFVFANWYQVEKDRECYDYFSEFVLIHPYLENLNGSWASLSYADLRKLYITTCASPSSGFILRRSSMPSGWNTQMNIGDDWCLLLEMILTKECKAAFTIEKLWRKEFDSLNLYENRNKVELFTLLYIADVREIMRLYAKYLTSRELKTLQKMHIEGLVEIAKHNLLHERKIPQFLRLTKQSLVLDVGFTFKTMRTIYKPIFTRQFKRLTNSFSKHQ